MAYAHLDLLECNDVDCTVGLRGVAFALRKVRSQRCQLVLKGGRRCFALELGVKGMSLLGYVLLSVNAAWLLAMAGAWPILLTGRMRQRLPAKYCNVIAGTQTPTSISITY